MSVLEIDLRPSQGRGRARAGGFYHVSFRSGSRVGGACARSSHDYIAREHQFDTPELDRAVYVESGHMPAWAEDDPREYWDAADMYERENGRLFVAGDFALPRGLELEAQIQLAGEFARDLADREKLPYTFAIHAGEDRDGGEHNPHVHVMVSERSNDGIERDRRQWFRRANRAHPERGGALKSRAFHGREWVEQARERLAAAINARLRDQGRQERVDHRSYARQGVDREPDEHFGPDAAHVLVRTGGDDRLEHAAETDQIPDRVAALDQQIRHFEHTRAALLEEERSLARDRRSPSRAASPTIEPDASRER